MPNESEPKGWWHTLPGILTAVAAVLSAITGLLVAIRSMDPSRTPAPAPAQAAPAAPAAPAAQGPPATQSQGLPSTGPMPPQARPAQGVHAGLDVSGTWRDNFGNVTRFQQVGAAVRFEGYGKACAGNSYRSRGSGTVSGNQIRSTYESTMPSTGSCVGLINDVGTSMTSTCTDSVCGTFVSAADRIQ